MSNDTATPASLALDLMHRSPVTECLHYGIAADCAISACVAARTAPACQGFDGACGAPAGQPCEPGCPSAASVEHDAAFGA